MAKKKGFDLTDPATLIGFIIGLLVTFVFGWYIGLIATVIVVIVYLIIDQKKVGNVLVGGLVGFLIGLLIWFILKAIGIVLVSI